MRRGSWLMALLLLVAPASAADLSDEERAWLDAHGPIRYAPDPDYPPFEFLTEDGVVGVNIDFLNRMSRNLDFEYEVVVYRNWTAVLEAMQAGDVDLLGSLAQTPERETYMDFIGPYMEVGEVFYVHVDRGDLTDLGDLSGQNVAVVQNYAAAEWLAQNHPEMQQVPVPDMLTGLAAVSSGEVDAFFENVPVAGYYIRQNAYNDIEILGEPLYYSPANWGVTKGEPHLYSIVSKGIDSVPLGEQAAVFEYWTGNDLSVQRDAPSSFSPLALGILGAVGLVAVAAGGWSWTLRRQVARQTAQLRDSHERIAVSKNELEDRVADRTDELKAAYEQDAAFRQQLDQRGEEAAGAFTALARDLRSKYHGVLRGPTSDLLDHAYASTWRLVDFVSQVEDLGRGQVTRRSEHRLQPVVEEAVGTYKARYGTDVDARVEDGVIEADRAQLRKLAYAAVALAGDQGVPFVAQPIEGGWRLTWQGIKLDTDGLLEPFHPVVGPRLAVVSAIIGHHAGRLELKRADDDLVLDFFL